jgi:hypothetical protein
LAALDVLSNQRFWHLSQESSASCEMTNWEHSFRLALTPGQPKGGVRMTVSRADVASAGIDEQERDYSTKTSEVISVCKFD